MTMFAGDTADTITSVAYVLAAVAFIVVAWRARHLVAEVRSVKVTMDTSIAPKIENVEHHAEENTRKIDEINTAVNHKLPHEPTMVKRLATVESSVQSLADKFDQYAADDVEWKRLLIGVIGVDVRLANSEQTTDERTHP